MAAKADNDRETVVNRDEANEADEAKPKSPKEPNWKNMMSEVGKRMREFVTVMRSKPE